jgi:Domain of unknown function (DUF2019)
MALTKSEIDQMLTTYIDAAIAHDQANRTQDHDAATKYTDLKANIYRRLKKDGHDALTAFHALMKHPNPAVQIAVAGFGLEFASDESEKVLEQLQTLVPDIIGVDAAMALFIWRSGEAEFPQ